MLGSVKELVLLLTAVTSALVSSAPSKDQIQHLPGLAQQPTFKQYSGYLSALGTKQLHYWFVESQNEPSSDPVVLWLNGGPGCSSLFGLLQENGPFRVQPDGKTLVANPSSWNTLTNVIYLEAPAGVGYSYSKDKDYRTDDDDTSLNNLVAMVDFFRKFPEYKKNDFYITGESYGGIYVPLLALRVVENTTINLKGFAVGNGLSDVKLNDNSVNFLTYYHGIVGSELWDKTLKDCCKGLPNDKCDFDKQRKVDKDCQNDISEIQKAMWESGLDSYNIYAKTVGGVRTTSQFSISSRRDWWPLLGDKDNSYQGTTHSFSDDDPIVRYLNRADVKKALHIPPGLPKWNVCSSVPYKQIYDTMKDIYQMLHGMMRIMVYNGDLDMVCNYLGDEWFVESLGFAKAGARKHWLYPDSDSTKQVGGFRQDYSGNVRLVTVMDAGHMVPQDQPRKALQMFADFIKNN